MKVGGKHIGKGKGGRGHGTQYPDYTSGVYTPAGLKGKHSKKSSSKAHAMYNSAMKHSV